MDRNSDEVIVAHLRTLTIRSDWIDQIEQAFKGVHFWKQACDDAHNLGAERLKIATDALEFVKKGVDDGMFEGYFNETDPEYIAVVKSLEKLA